MNNNKTVAVCPNCGREHTHGTNTQALVCLCYLGVKSVKHTDGKMTNVLGYSGRNCMTIMLMRPGISPIMTGAPTGVNIDVIPFERVAA